MSHDTAAAFSLVTLNGVLEFPLPCPCPECSPMGTHTYPRIVDGGPFVFRAMGMPNGCWHWKHEPRPSTV